MTELPVPYTPPRTLRTSTDQLLAVQKYKLKHFDARSFETAAPALWNSLESQVRLQKILTSFRRSLKINLFGELMQLDTCAMQDFIHLFIKTTMSDCMEFCVRYVIIYGMYHGFPMQPELITEWTWQPTNT